MLVLHALAIAFLLASFALDGGVFSARVAAVVLVYALLVLASSLARHRVAMRGLHLVALVPVLFVAASWNVTLLLLPFHLVAILAGAGQGIADAGRIARFAAYAAVIVIAAIVPPWPPTELAAFVVLSVAVFLLDERLARDDAVRRRLQSRLDDADIERERLARAQRSDDRTFAAVEHATRLEERRAVATRLHDDLGHMVTGSLFQLEAARLLVDDDPASAGEMIDRARAALREGMDSIRASLRTIDPPTEELGIVRLEHETYEFERRTGIRASVGVGGRIDEIPPEIWRVIHRNATEALTNCARHSSATSVDLTVNVYPGAIRFRVCDNGRPSGKPVRYGMGLQAIEERSSASGGITTVDTNHGFSVVSLWKRGQECRSRS